MKLWIRLDADTPRDPRIGQLADQLGVSPNHALGSVVAVWCAMGEHRPNGDLTGVSDSTLNAWAGFSRGSGRRPLGSAEFSAAFRELFLVDGVRDPLFGEQQGALVERARRDRERKGRPPSPESSEEIPGNFRGNASEIRGYGTEQDGTEKRNATSVNGGRVAAPEELRARALAEWSRLLDIRQSHESPTGGRRFSLSQQAISALPERTQYALRLAGGRGAVTTADEVALRTNRAAFRDAYVGFPKP